MLWILLVVWIGCLDFMPIRMVASSELKASFSSSIPL